MCLENLYFFMGLIYSFHHVDFLHGATVPILFLEISQLTASFCNLALESFDLFADWGILEDIRNRMYIFIVLRG